MRRPGAAMTGILNLLSGPGHTVKGILSEGDEIGGLRVIETPGHTPGHLAYWEDTTRVLILGDLLFHRNPVWDSGASPEIILTKSDLAEDLDSWFSQVEAVSVGVPVRIVSARDRESVEALRDTLTAGSTVSLLGPSGVGKSTLVNLLSEATVAETGEVRSGDRKGRHVTTRRDLYRIPGGALLLDTPGIRELRVWVLDDGLNRAFPDIEELAQGCRFRDCRHEGEPACAVQEALKTGTLDPERLGSFQKLRAESEYETRKTDPRARAAAVSEWKTAVKTLKQHPKYKNR